MIPLAVRSLMMSLIAKNMAGVITSISNTLGNLILVRYQGTRIIHFTRFSHRISLARQYADAFFFLLV
jgi:uncharacterized phage infection (PIP) family protein YhgE